MFKKIFIILFFFIFINITCLSKWENINIKTKKIEVDFNKIWNKINSIQTYFCNNWLNQKDLTENLSLVLSPWEEKEICIIQFNLSSWDIYSRWAFPNLITHSWWSFCNDNNSRDNPFSKYIKKFDNDKIKIPAKWYTIRRTTIKFPIWTSWMQYGCFAYGEKKDSEADQMINFIIRKTLRLKFFVSWEWKIKNDISISNISNNFDENKKIYLNFNLNNNWSVDEMIDINLNLSNIFWFKKSYSLNWEIIWTNNSKTISTQDLWENIELPRYKWPFKIKTTVKFKPHFDFDVSNAWIDPKILEWWTTTQTKTMFIFPTIPAIWLLVFILLIYLAFFRKPKVIIQQVPSNK